MVDRVETRVEAMRRLLLSVLCLVTSLSIVVVVLCSASSSSPAAHMETSVRSNLAMQTGGVSGYVLDQGTLAAIGGATVKLIRAGVEQAQVITSASGYYAFANLVAGTYTLSVNASGYQNSSHVMTVSDSGAVLDFYLSPIPPGTFQLSGHVYAQGTTVPIEGATIRVGTSSVVTGTDGHYSILLAGGSHILRVNATGYQTDTHNLTSYGSDVMLDFYLAPVSGGTHRLSGYVYAQGTTNPIEGAKLQAGEYSAVTDASGHYSMLLLDGTYTVTITAAGYDRCNSSVRVAGGDAEKHFEMSPKSTQWSPLLVAGIVGIVVVAGGGVAWALTRGFGGRGAASPGLGKSAPQDYHKLTEFPQDYHKITETPQDYHKLTVSPQDLHKITESPQDLHKITESPLEYHKATESPQEFHKMTELPQDYHKLTESPQDLHKITESPLEAHKLTESPQELHKLTESPQDYHKITETPQDYHKLTESPQDLHKTTESTQTAGQTTQAAGKDQVSESVAKKRRRL